MTKLTYKDIQQHAMAANTRKVYALGWKKFVRWCDAHKVDSLPASPDAVTDFLIEMATSPASNAGKSYSIGTISIFCSAITRKHLDAELSPPTHSPKVIKTVTGLRRMDNRVVKQVKALREDDIEKMIGACGDDLIGLRNAAVIAIGFAAALRRSEICNLKVADVSITETVQGKKMILTIRKSKTDQQGLGQKIAIPAGKRIAPILRLERWLVASDIADGYLFRSLWRGGALRAGRLHHSDIPRMLKHYAALVGLDTSEISGHSLRAGFVTSAAANGARIDKIMEITRHKSPAMVMKYIRDANVFDNHAGDSFL